MPSSPGKSIERVSASGKAKVHAGGTVPAARIAPCMCFRKVRLEVIMRPHPSGAILASARTTSPNTPEVSILIKLHHRPGKGEKPKPGRRLPEDLPTPEQRQQASTS